MANEKDDQEQGVSTLSLVCVRVGLGKKFLRPESVASSVRGQGQGFVQSGP